MVKRFVLSPSCVLNLQIANPAPENDIISATEVVFSTVKKGAFWLIHCSLLV